MKDYMKPYQQILIKECGESLIPLCRKDFVFETPHPYQKLGAPYGGVSPYFLRRGVVEALHKAQRQLEAQALGWRLKIFDAYRPIAVQQFMVDYTFKALAIQHPEQEQKSIEEQVSKFWAQPSLDPQTPPPHSTGAAVDLTLVDDQGETLDLGGEIDEISPRSKPNFYQHSRDAFGQNYHQRRQVLQQVMFSAGFEQHPQEWWHFSLGDQLWAWLKSQQFSQIKLVAYYGRVYSHLDGG